MCNAAALFYGGRRPAHHALSIRRLAIFATWDAMWNMMPKTRIQPPQATPVRWVLGMPLRRMSAMKWNRAILGAGGLTLVLGLLAGAIGFQVHALLGLQTFIQLSALYALIHAGASPRTHALQLVTMTLLIETAFRTMVGAV